MPGPCQRRRKKTCPPCVQTEAQFPLSFHLVTNMGYLLLFVLWLLFFLTQTPDKETPPVYGDYNRDPDIKALKRRGLFSVGLDYSSKLYTLKRVHFLFHDPYIILIFPNMKALKRRGLLIRRPQNVPYNPYITNPL